MISDDVLTVAVDRGVLNADQVARLRVLAQELNSPAGTEPEDPEKLRFVSGFGDVFVTMGLLLLAYGAWYLVLRVAGYVGAWLALAAIAWVLGEFFTRRRRMALPSIVLLILFGVSAFATFNWLLALLNGNSHQDPGGIEIFGFHKFHETRPLALTLASLLSVLAVGVHYKRFQVPITVASAAAGLILAVCTALAAVAPEFITDHFKWIILAAGLIVFVAAMRYDLSDPKRVTRRTDIAFWLHLLAAPLIVNPLIGPFKHVSMPGSGVALGMLAMFVALGAVAVIIDRRAMLASGLLYAGVAFGILLRQADLTDQTFPLTLLALGAFVLLLSAGWQPVRRVLLALLPTRLTRALPHSPVSA